MKTDWVRIFKVYRVPVRPKMAFTKIAKAIIVQNALLLWNSGGTIAVSGEGVAGWEMLTSTRSVSVGMLRFIICASFGISLDYFHLRWIPGKLQLAFGVRMG